MAKAKFKDTRELVWIEWLDAVSTDEWTAVEDVSSECHVIETVGWIVAETPETITLAPNHDRISDNVACYIAIPKAWIQDRKALVFAPRPRTARRAAPKRRRVSNQ